LTISFLIGAFKTILRIDPFPNRNFMIRRNMSKHSRKHIQEVLDKNPSCYVLITCGEPAEDGQMQVEMTYQGDAMLASYLLQGAQLCMDQEEAWTEATPQIQLVK
jgi:hypothetical protein